MTQAPATPELVERLNEHVRYEYMPTAARLAMEQAAAALEAQQARIAELEAKLSADDAEHDATETDRDIWHEIADERLAKLKASQALADRYETALRDLIEHFEGDQEHDEGAFDEGCPDCLALQFARQALSSQGRHEGGGDSSSRSQPSGVGPSDLTDPQSQHSDGGRDV